MAFKYYAVSTHYLSMHALFTSHSEFGQKITTELTKIHLVKTQKKQNKSEIGAERVLDWEKMAEVNEQFFPFSLCINDRPALE